jgi:hypothetical protein
MAKFKLAKPKKKTAPGGLRAVPCIVLIVTTIALISLLFALALRSS